MSNEPAPSVEEDQRQRHQDRRRDRGQQCEEMPDALARHLYARHRIGVERREDRPQRCDGEPQQ